MEELDEPGQAAPFDMAQAAPRETFEQMQQRRRDSGSSNTTPGGTPIGPPKPPIPASNSGSSGFIEPKQSKPGPELDKSLKGFEIDQKAAQEGAKKHPGAADLESWYGTLSPKQKEMANQLQDFYKSKGYKGWFDPAIKGKELELRNYLFDQTSGKWNNRMEKKEKRPGPGAAPEGGEQDMSPEKFFGGGKGKRSELKEEAPALAKLGGNYMDEGDEA